MKNINRHQLSNTLNVRTAAQKPVPVRLRILRKYLLRASQLGEDSEVRKPPVLFCPFKLLQKRQVTRQKRGLSLANTLLTAGALRVYDAAKGRKPKVN